MKSDTNLLIRVAAALFIIFCLVTIIELQVRMNRLDGEKEELKNEIAKLKEENAEIQYEIDLPYDDDYVARVARNILGYHFPDELLFINDMYEE